MMKRKLLKPPFFLVLLLLPGLLNISPVQAGEPDDTIGPPDINMLICTERNTHLFFDLDSDAFNRDGTRNPDLEVKDVKKLEEDCKNAANSYNLDLGLEFARQSRIEGYVFEFHPDPNGPGGWTAVRSRDVPVVASGPGFQIEWGSEKDGQYFFNNLGGGPVTLNLRLPPDAHPINPNITVMTTGFPDIWEVDLGFYRGSTPPEDINELHLPADHARSTLVDPDTRLEIDENGVISEMPDVGGVLPLDQPTSTIALAVVVLVILPAAGILKLHRSKRVQD